MFLCQHFENVIKDQITLNKRLMFLEECLFRTLRILPENIPRYFLEKVQSFDRGSTLSYKS